MELFQYNQSLKHAENVHKFISEQMEQQLAGLLTQARAQSLLTSTAYRGAVNVDRTPEEVYADIKESLLP